MALALVARLTDEATARMVQLAIEYDPHPPFGGIDWSRVDRDGYEAMLGPMVQRQLAGCPELLTQTEGLNVKKTHVPSAIRWAPGRPSTHAGGRLACSLVLWRPRLPAAAIRELPTLTVFVGDHVSDHWTVQKAAARAQLAGLDGQL
jgi:hypothetical protein